MRPWPPKSCTSTTKATSTGCLPGAIGGNIWKVSGWGKTCGSALRSTLPGMSPFIGRVKFSLIADQLQSLKIGPLELANPLVLAPLSGISDLPFRLLAKEQGCALVGTEMISAEGLLHNRRATERLLQSRPEEGPLSVQIFGSRSGSMEEAARIIEDYGADVLDINMGCPVRKVVRGGSGAALLKDPERAKEIIQAVRRAVSIPLTVKIRSGWDEKSLNYLEMARMAEDLGVDALTLHGRARTHGYGIKADWGVIGRAKAELRIPVIGNG